MKNCEKLWKTAEKLDVTEVCRKLSRWHLGLQDLDLGSRVLQALKDSTTLVAPQGMVIGLWK